MRILQIFNKYAYVGGEEIAVAQITAEVSSFHELRNIVFDSNEWASHTSLMSRMRQFIAMAWNPASIRRVRAEISDFRPEVILIHNLMPVGSAALYQYLSKCGVPVISYIHNFRPFSVNGYCWGNGKLLDQGLSRNYLPEILAGSWQNSVIKTAWYGLLIWILHRRGAFERISGWIAISEFMKNTFVKGGITPAKIQVIPHSWQPTANGTGSEEDARGGGNPEFLFLGRLTEEKGLRVLLDAWEKFSSSGGKGHLRIAGDGPLKEEIETACTRLRGVSYEGFKTGPEKQELLRRCSALVVPSIWWEPLGLVLYEAYDHGKPVLAARSGGIVDNVEDHETGWLHTPGDAGELSRHFLEVAQDPLEARRRGHSGHELLKQRSAKVWIHEFDGFVSSVIASHAAVHEPGRIATGRTSDTLSIQTYLADQNPGHDRSFGISRMSQVVLESLRKNKSVRISAIVSKTSQQAPDGVDEVRTLPWGTRRKFVRLVTDHLHPLFSGNDPSVSLHYFPKGYLPLLSVLCKPSVVTIHDTIIQYDEDHYPEWRKRWEYAYWAMMLKHTVRNADRIMTVSESSKRQISEFMERHGIRRKEITVTYEPCLYEALPQPLNPVKENYVIHLASCEPHKRTSHLVRWWREAESRHPDLPMLHLIGTVPPDVAPILATSKTIVKRPFLEDTALQAAYLAAKALILPSEIEGFGLPALEAYYLGTPVCFVRGTSVEEVLSVATDQGGFTLDSLDSLIAALEEVMAMDATEVRRCGLKLRGAYAAAGVAERMLAVFREVSTP